MATIIKLFLIPFLLIFLSYPAEAQRVRTSDPTSADSGVVVRNIPSGIQAVTLNQRDTLLNTETASAVNTAVTTTVAAAAAARAHLYKMSARCSAGTAAVDVDDGASQIWSTSAAEVTTTNLTERWNPGLTGTTNTAMTITLGACGAGNTGTLSVQADRF